MQRRQPPRHRTGKRRVNVKARLVSHVVVLILICVAAYFIRAAVIIGIGRQTYYNVKINGVSLEGYTRQEAEDMFDELISEWAAREYTLTYGDKSWTFTAADFDASLEVNSLLENAWNLGHVGSISSRCNVILSMRENEYSFISDMDYDELKLDKFVYSISAETDCDPVNAEVLLDVDAPRMLTQSQNGARLDVEATRETIISLLVMGTGDTELKVDVIAPEVSSDEVSGGLGVIASYSTDMTTSSSKRYENVKLALSNFNCMAVYDGDTVSFNEVVGERTKERGYREAAEYAGTSVVTGYGGGSCQASTTLYCAAIMAGMDIIERHPHNMTVAYAEPSLDATVSWGSKDFVFRNSTGHTIYIYTNVTREAATVIIYGNRTEYRYEFQSVITRPGVEAYKEEIREDVTGQHAYYTDEKVLYSKGKDGCVSQGWLISYDWETGEEVERIQVSQDTYSPGTSIFYVGVHERAEELAPSIQDGGF